MHATITFLIRYKATAMALACTAAIGVPLATLAYTPGRPLALQTLFLADKTLPQHYVGIGNIGLADYKHNVDPPHYIIQLWLK